VLQDDGTYVAKKWRDVKVGDVIMVMENEYLPVDLVILRTSADNVCYIETKNLDGETNLKHKQAP
jgi:P-type E1-E2 ATPase